MKTSVFKFPASLDGQRILTLQYRYILVIAVIAGAALLLPLNTLHVPLSVYVPIHTLLESLSILAAFLAFATVWCTPARNVSADMVMVSLGLLAAGCLDFLHTQSILGMPDLVTANSTQKSVAFWLAARFAAVIGFLLASFMSTTTVVKPAYRRSVATAYLLFVVLSSYVVLFQPDALPAFFITGQGTTSLKSASETLLVLMLAFAAWQYWQASQKSDESYYPLMFGALAIAAIGEFFFAGYTVANDSHNLIGHILKIVSYWLIFQAMFVLGSRKPYEMLEVETNRLQAANENLRIQSMVLECTATPVVITDLEGAVKWRNPVSSALSALMPPGPYRIFEPMMSPDPVQLHEMRTALDAGKTWRGRVKLRSIYGTDIHLDRTVTHLRNSNGMVEGYVVASENVTDSVMADSRNKRVLDKALDGFWVVNSKGRFIEVNAAYCAMIGYSKAELLTMDITDIEAAEDQAETKAHLSKIIATGSDQFRTRHRCKDGTIISVEVSVTFDPENENLYVFIRDQTEQERASIARHDLERKLNHSQKMQALGQLTGGIAHDFNNILASILGYANLSITRYTAGADPKLTQYLKEIVGAGERARDLIAKMLTFARMQPSGPAALISPASVVNEVVAMLAPSIPAIIQLRSSIETECLIRMNPGELNQVLVNMIINARDAIAGQGKIDLRVRPVSMNDRLCALTGERITGIFLCIDIADNGIGIPKEHLGSIFNPFFTTKDVGKGTGLGLSVVQGIMQKCGGHIALHSDPGYGTLFQLLFKMELTEPEVSAPMPGESRHKREGTGQVIWVVDDERAVGDFIGELLDGGGYTVRVFNDPGTALNTYKTERCHVDLLITDQTMPGMTGVQLAGLLRSELTSLPVILCTGYSDGIPAGELQGQVIQELLIKPVAADTLLTCITQILLPEM